jgi:hypothetical protein
MSKIPPSRFHKADSIPSDHQPATGVARINTTSRALGDAACASPDLAIHLNAKGHPTTKCEK